MHMPELIIQLHDRSRQFWFMKKILVVDDDTDLLEIVRLSLNTSGYEVILANTCAEGIKTFYREKPDLVLMDINVRDEDGREMCKQIKSDAAYQHIPVILISGNSEALSTYKKYGANDAINKPFEVALLTDRVGRYLAI